MPYPILPPLKLTYKHKMYEMIILKVLAIIGATIVGAILTVIIVSGALITLMSLIGLIKNLVTSRHGGPAPAGGHC